MNPAERVGVFLIGALIGFGFGYIVRLLQDIRDRQDTMKAELDEVEAAVKKYHPDEDDGFVSMPILKDIALFIVVLVVAWSAISTALTNNDVKETQAQQGQLQEFVVNISTCNQQFLSATIRALNQRTESTQQRADANLELQKDQAAFFSLLLGEPQPPENVRRKAAEKYLDSLTHFVEQSNRTEQQNDSFPYPTNEELTNCINDRRTP